MPIQIGEIQDAEPLRVTEPTPEMNEPPMPPLAAAESTTDEPTAARQRHHNEGHGRRLKLHLLPFFGSMPLGSITPLEVRRFVASLVDAGYRPSTVRTIYGCFRSIMAAAVEAELLMVSPFKKLPYSSMPSPK